MVDILLFLFLIACFMALIYIKVLDAIDVILYILCFFMTLGFSLWFSTYSTTNGFICITLFLAFTIHMIIEQYTSRWFSPRIMFRNIFSTLIYFDFLMIIFSISGSIFMMILIGYFTCIVLGIINYELKQWRGKPLFINDFFSIKTALQVSKGYKFIIKTDVIFITIFAIINFMVSIQLINRLDLFIELKALNLKIIRSIALIETLLLYFIIFKTNLFERIHILPNFWETGINGYILNFLLQGKVFKIQKPKDYRAEKIDEVFIKKKEEDKNGIQNFPNLIVIMNESFADLNAIGPIVTNVPVCPYFKSLMKESVSGSCYVSVYGGNTANSEYEFLTGNSMIQFPAGNIPFELYIYKHFPSLISHMKKQGYHTSVMHPCNKRNWNRENVYNNMEIDEQIFLDKYEDIRMLRGSVSDDCNYENLIRNFEKKLSDKPQFIFNITMQNHGGYEELPEEINRVRILDKGNYTNFNQAEVYLSLLNKSDSALKKIVEYFRNIKQPTVICFFGDHQPKIESALLEQLYGKSLQKLTLDEYERMYRVPFFIWSNYGLVAEKYNDISLNFLSSILLDTIGIPRNVYQEYLLKLQRDVPVVNSFGYKKAEENSFCPLTACNEDLNLYKCLMYNYLFDRNTIKMFEE